MLAGRAFKTSELQYRACAYAGTSTGSSTSGMFGWRNEHRATLATGFTPDYLGFSLGFYLAASSARTVSTNISLPTESPTTSWTLTFPALATDTAITDPSFTSEAESLLRFYDVAIYQDSSGLWRVIVGSIEWYGNGVLLGSWGSQSWFGSMFPAPMAIPIIPGTADITAAAIVTRGDPTGVVLPSASQADASTTARCGYRWKGLDGAWYSPPVSMPDIFTIGSSGISHSGIATAGNTWDGVLTAITHRQYDVPSNGSRGGYDTYGRYVREYGGSGTCRLVPDPEGGVVRLCDDYALLVQRRGFPSVTAMARVVDLVNFPPGTPPPYIATEEREAIAALPAFLEVAGQTPSSLEEPLGVDAPCGLDLGASETEITLKYDIAVTPGTTASPWIGYTPPPGTAGWLETTIHKNGGVYFTYPEKVEQGPGAAYAIAPALDHAEPFVRYVNTWGNPLWSFWAFYPPEAAPPSIRWEQGGVPYDPQEAWLPMRQQVAKNPYLPGGGPKTRISIATEPLSQNGLASLMLNNVAGQKTSYWGVSRFDALEATYPAHWDYTDDGSYSVPVGGGGSLAGMVFTPSAASACRVDLSIFDFNRTPYQAGQIAKSVRWQAPGGMTTPRLWLVAADGTEHELGPADSTQYDFPREAPGAEYAGTWARDYSCGDGPPDQGADVAAGGVSLATLADDSLGIGLGLPQNRGWVTLSLRWTAPTTAAVTLNDARIYPPTENCEGIITAPREAAVMWPDSRGVRMGQLGYWDYLLDSFLYPPVSEGPCLAMTALDGLCLSRTLLEGKAATDGLDAQIADLYENGIEYAVRANLAREVETKQLWTSAFVHCTGELAWPTICLVSSLREVPPLAGYPRRKRDAELQETGDYGTWVYSKATDTHRTAVGGSEPLQLRTPGADQLATSQVGSVDSGAPSGWAWWRWRLPNSQDADDSYGLWAGGKKIVEGSPHRGYFAAIDALKASGSVFASQTADGRYLRSRTDAAEPIAFGATRVGAPKTGGWLFDGPILGEPGGASDASHVIDPQTGRLWLYAEKAAGIYEAWSDDDGKTFGGWDLLGDGLRPLAGENGGDRLTVWQDPDAGTSGPGKLRGRFRGRGATSAVEFDLLVSSAAGVAPSALRTDDKDRHGNPVGMRDAQGRWSMSVTPEGETDLWELASFDEKGETWLRVG